MQIATGKVVAGKVVVEGLALGEGEVVTVLAHDAQEHASLSPAEEAELLQAIAEADSGQTISGDELTSRLLNLR